MITKNDIHVGITSRIEFEKLDRFGGLRVSKIITTPNGNEIRGIAGHARTLMLIAVDSDDGLTVVVTPDSDTVMEFEIGDLGKLWDLAVKVYRTLTGGGGGGGNGNGGGGGDCGDFDLQAKGTLKDGKKVTLTASCGPA